MLNLQSFCRVHKAFPLDGEWQVYQVDSTPAVKHSSLLWDSPLILPPLSGALLYLVLICGHHHWLCFSATVLAFLFPLLLC